MAAELIDLRHLGRDRVIGAWRVDDVLVDPGPEACVSELLGGLGAWQPRAIALTHIYLDHAGATGTLARLWPDAEVWVHERGAPHLVDPARLVASAGRLYGADMQRLWGEVVAVPEGRLRVLSGGERLGDLEVDYAPGHASHHVLYRHRPSGTAFVGDVAGVRIMPAEFVLAPTPPPDIDVERWLNTLDGLERSEPAALAITHFGLVRDVAEHLARLRSRLTQWADLARESPQEQFVAQVRARIARATDPVTAAHYEQGAPPDQLWLGLRRYWERREPAD